MSTVHRSATFALVLFVWMPLDAVATGVIVVGNGTAASCTQMRLESALNAARASGGGTIRFRCGPDPVTIPLTATLVIPTNTTIDGNGRIILDGGSQVVALVEYQATAVVQDLSIRQASGIHNEGTLTVRNSSFRDYSGPAIVNRGSLDVRSSIFWGGSGGGIYNDGGTASVSNSMFAGVAFPSSAITNVGGSLTVRNSVFSGNSGFSRTGGIYNDGDLTVEGCGFFDNRSHAPGAIEHVGGTLAVRYSTFSGVASEVAVISTQNGVGTVENSTFSDNAGLAAGAILNGGVLTIANSTFTRNRSGSFTGAGAIHNTGTLSVVNSQISGNEIHTSMPGVGNPPVGGILNKGALTVRNSLITHNVAVSEDPLPPGVGGILTCCGGTPPILQNTLVLENTPNDVSP
jgi:parallel beta helix pectate lyase-like protein